MKRKNLPASFLLQSFSLKHITMLLSLLFFIGTVQSQVLLERNATGSTGSSLQLGSTTAKRTQQLYTPREVGASVGGTNENVYGFIDEVYFMYHSTTTLTLTDFEIYIGQTADTTLTVNLDNNATNSGMMKVLGPTTFVIPAGTAGDWFAIPLTTAFPNYDPRLSIVVETRWNTSSSSSWNVRTGTNDVSGVNRKAIANSPTGSTGSVTTSRANFRFRVTPAFADDAGIVAINTPTSPSNPGVNAVEVKLQNFGSSVLNTVQINWSINDVIQTPFSWTGGLTTGGMVDVPVGTGLFNPGNNTIKAWTTSPNGSVDPINGNDTATTTVIFCSPLTGTLIINSAFPASDPSIGQFKNFTDLAASLGSCGINGNVTVNVAPNSGPYLEQVVFTTIPNASSAATVTINGNGNTITAGTADPDRHVIRLQDVSYFNLTNLTVAALNPTSGTRFFGVHVYNTGNNINISNVNVEMTGTTSSLSSGIVCSGSLTSNLTAGSFTNIVITKNTITGGGYGVSFMGNANTGLVIDSNAIYDYSSNGIYTRGTAEAIISNNIISKRAGAAGVNGIQLAQSDNNNTRIFKNRISHPHTAVGTFRGIYVFGGGGHMIYNNVVHDVRAETGTNVYAISVRSAAKVYFNTVVLNHSAASTVPLYAFAEESANTGAELRNNIFVVEQATSGAKAGILLSSTSAITTAVSSDYNVFWVPGGNIALRDGVGYSLSSWRTASGQDINSVETDPSFQAGTVIPTSGIIDNIGTAIAGITTDIAGTPRNANPDPGAYEFAPANNDAALTGFVLPPLPYCATNLVVQFVLTNAGAVPLTSATINWTVNGVPQTAVNWTGNVATGDTAIVTLGNVPVSGINTYSFSATVSSPNGQADANAGNNSFTYSGFRRGIQGNISINVGLPVSASNYHTFQSVSEALSAYGICGPVTIDVLSGPYTEQVSFDSIPGTSSTNVVTLNGNGQELNFNPTVAATDHILRLSNVHHFVVQNLVVRSTHASNGRGIFITNGSSHITLQGNTVEVSSSVTSSSAFPILASGTSYLLDGTLSTNLNITGNTVRGGYIGIQLTGDAFTSVATKLVNSTVANNTIEDWYIAGVQLTYTHGVSVVGNSVSRPTKSTPATGSGSNAAISVPSGSSEYVIDKNRLHNFHGGMAGTTSNSIGIYLAGTTTARSDGLIKNNLIYGMTNNGAQYGVQIDGTYVTANVFHNTIVLDQGAGTSSSIAIYLSNSSAQNGGANIRNNILYVTRGGTGTKRIIDVANANTVFSSDYNVTWLVPSAGTGIFGGLGTADYPLLADWIAGANRDSNSVHADPMFINPAAGDFTPSNPAIDASAMNTVSVGVMDDFLGAPRNSKPDPGAFEFNLTTYVFNGNGNWNVASNWVGGLMPPSPLPAGSEVIINPVTSATLNVPFTLSPGGKLTVKAGKILIIPGDLTIQ